MKKIDFSKYENKNVSYELTTDYPSLRLEKGRMKIQEGKVKVGSSLPRCKQLKKKDSSKSPWIAAAAGAAATAVAFFLGGRQSGETNDHQLRPVQ